MYFSPYGVFAAVDISADYADKSSQFVSMMVKQCVLDLGRLVQQETDLIDWGRKRGKVWQFNRDGGQVSQSNCR